MQIDFITEFYKRKSIFAKKTYFQPDSNRSRLPGIPVYPKKPPENPRKPNTKITATAEQPIATHVLVSSQSSPSSLSPVQSSHK